MRAVHEASGNSFEAVSDGAGAYQLAVRIGIYQISAELAGFAPFDRAGLQLQVGQQAVVNVELALAGVAESVTVTGRSAADRCLLVDAGRQQSNRRRWRSCR